jgi:arginine deiminase
VTFVAFGANSEVGKLRKVIVHRPDLSLKRLTPSTKDDLLFDDVLWVEHAQTEHDEFVAMLRGRGVEVYYHHELLAEALDADIEAKQHAIEKSVTHLTVGPAAVDAIRSELSTWDGTRLATHLICVPATRKARSTCARSRTVSGPSKMHSASGD